MTKFILCPAVILMIALGPVFALGQTAIPSTPIKHLVIIFPENISFDHYFGTYPHAENPANEPKFTALPHTPTVNGLSTVLLTRNANAANPANGVGAVNPFRLDRSQAATADQNHAYTPEQMAFHSGLMDLFPKSVGRGNPPQTGSGSPLNTTGLTMGYFDGNTVTALWNYAQHFAMSDNSFGSTFGPSTPGAINLVSGQTNGVVDIRNGRGGLADGGNGSFTLISDPDPVGDVCSASDENARLDGGKQYRQSAQRRERHVGMVQRRVRSYRHQYERHHELQAIIQIPHKRQDRAGLHSSPRAISVLSINGKSDACSSGSVKSIGKRATRKSSV